ncbi:adenylate/guanylate cyclase domain-containing protein [Nitrogeniibacter mangrovi]|uniref:Adenylate/guanylate cyclase domain-containing protein n=1 Tax=Nitrogeniibacter mangrovi TaxID=2016596 RepID=A0A6C1B5D5_9RHOO|nr:adenylate/guanylate cyclase domain-containing protein [Nitrogeniibacter mangrovi]QID17500.1 adenylate/guanylate cyclase domain-containing protein [Nitrogeniibacter mangrovi]
MNRVWKRTFLLLLASVLIVGALWLSPLQGLERSTGLSTLYAVRGIRMPPESVVIVALDAASAQQLGVPRRPDLWPRSFHATLVDGLARSGAVAVGFDLLFEQPGDPADDAAFAAALERAGNVVLAERVVRKIVRADGGRVLGGVDRLIRPMPRLAEAAWVTAPFVLPKTLDGVFEFWTFPTGAGGNPSMPVRLFERWSNAYGHSPRYPAGAGDRLVLNLYGPFGTLPIISYADALERIRHGGTIPEAKGKVVLVGLAESNQSLQFDAYHTPYSRSDGVDINGVELAATAVANMMEGSSLKPWHGRQAMALVLGWTAMLALMWGLARAGVAAVLTVVAMTGFGVAAAHAFSSSFVWMPVVFPLFFCPLVVTALGMVFKYRRARGRHRRLQQMLGADRRRGAVDRIAAAFETRPHGRVLRAVCLSSDIAAYTAMAEGKTPAEARDMLNGYLAHFLPIVESHGGDVTDLVGDSVMCLWVVGKDEAGACRRAVAAAVALDERMNARAADGTLPTRFGLHVGDVFFGELGVGDRMEIRPVGDVVNTASRIQSACKPLGLTVLASEAVTRHLEPSTLCLLGRFRFKGKQDLHILGTPFGVRSPAAANAAFTQALSCFSVGDIDAAARGFEAVLQRWPEHRPAHFYRKVCALPAMRDNGAVVFSRG